MKFTAQVHFSYQKVFEADSSEQAMGIAKAQRDAYLRPETAPDDTDSGWTVTHSELSVSQRPTRKEDL